MLLYWRHMKNREIIRTSLAIYLPSLLVQLGASLTMSFNVLWSRDLGAGVAMIGLIAAGNGIGSLIFDLPGGWIGGKVREKPFMIAAVAGLVLTGIFKAAATRPWQLLGIGMFMGMCVSAWGIGRLAYIRKNIPRRYRGRTLAYMGGIMRVARIATPALGGLIIQLLGFRVLYGVQAFLFASALVLLLVMMKDGSYLESGQAPASSVLKETFAKNGRNIVAAMIGIGGLQLLRISRNLIFPLWADSIGMSALLIGGFTSVGGLVETAMVVPAGITLDRAGRKWAAVPCTLGFALSMALMPLALTPAALAGVYLLMSLSNGLGSGINMTISSDLAPKNAAAEFLGIWRFVTDTSRLTGPLIAGSVAAAVSLPAAPLTAASAGLISAAVLMFAMDEPGRNTQIPARYRQTPARTSQKPDQNMDQPGRNNQKPGRIDQKTGQTTGPKNQSPTSPD